MTGAGAEVSGAGTEVAGGVVPAPEPIAVVIVPDSM